MTVAAVIPVWNGREDLDRLLQTLAGQTLRAAEIVAVDNGSTDGAPQIARERGARVIAMGHNAGFAAAVNRGIRECQALAAKPDWIAVLNSDVELASDYLQKLAGADGWFATGKLLARRDPSTCIIDGTFDAICRGGTAWRVGSGHEDGPLFSERQPIGCAPWTAILLRTAIFERVGLLEEAFESYLEDVDFGLRCAALGLQGTYEPGAVARHKGSATLGRWHPEIVRRMARNQIYLLARHYPRTLLIRWLRPIIAAHLLWGGVSVRHRATLSWVMGVREGLAGFSRMREASKPIEPKTLRALALSQEQTIRQVQSASGYDPYWRWYFRLAGTEA